MPLVLAVDGGFALARSSSPLKLFRNVKRSLRCLPSGFCRSFSVYRQTVSKSSSASREMALNARISLSLHAVVGFRWKSLAMRRDVSDFGRLSVFSISPPWGLGGITEVEEEEEEEGGGFKGGLLSPLSFFGLPPFEPCSLPLIPCSAPSLPPFALASLIDSSLII